jgi:hypothetical protein
VEGFEGAEMGGGYEQPPYDQESTAYEQSWHILPPDYNYAPEDDLRYT